jgi:hypothetical protein
MGKGLTDILSLIISLLAVATAALSGYITFYHYRRNEMRASVFNRQLEVYVNFLELMHKYHEAIDSYSTDVGIPVEAGESVDDNDFKEIMEIEKEINESKQIVEDEEAALRNFIFKYSILLPPPVLSIYFKWFNLCRAVYKRIREKQKEHIHDTEEEDKQLEGLFVQLLNIEDSIRTEIGIEKLTKENRNLIRHIKD